MKKIDLRKVYLEKQKSLSVVEREEKSRQIADRFFDQFELNDIEFLHIFLPIEQNREINTFIFIERLRRNFPAVKIVVPRVDFETLIIENLEFTAATKLIENNWRILEPESGMTIENQKIDACLVPLLCFDEKGFRAGYGKGFYDKFLSECRADCLKIGLSYFLSVEEISDTQDFDVKLDFCVTPQEVYEFKK